LKTTQTAAALDNRANEHFQCIDSKDCRLSYAATSLHDPAGRVRHGNAQRILCPNCYERHVARLNASDRRQRQPIERCAHMQAERDTVREIYLDASRLSQKFGIPYHVAHQVPRTGKRKGEDIVTGLYVSDNVRIVVYAVCRLDPAPQLPVMHDFGDGEK